MKGEKMYIITCRRKEEELKLIHDDDIKYNWGKDIFKAVTFETKEDAVNFIIKEPLFVNINKTENLLPFLLSDINIDSVHITKIEEIIYKNVAQVKFDKILKKLKK